MFNWTDSNDSHIINDILDSHSYSSVSYYIQYYLVGIGYLYAITYYYSMLDIILNQNLYQSKGLFTTVTTLSSLVKITPQFLGQLCLVKKHEWN